MIGRTVLVLAAAAAAASWPVAGARRRLVPGRPRRVGTLLELRGPATVAVAVAAVALWPGVPGAVVGVCAARLAHWTVGRLAERPDPRARRLLQGQAAGAADCLSACLGAGAPTLHAIEVVADAFGAPIGPMLARAAHLSRMGAPIEQAWEHVLAEPVLTSLGKVFVRSSESGVALTRALTACAEELRAERRLDLDRRARALGVKAVAPLGLCFLPAFVLLGVAPIVGGLVEQVL